MLRKLYFSYIAQNPSGLVMFTYSIIIVAFLENATIECSLECVCMGGGVFLHDNSKRYRFRNKKLECDVVYENSSDEFDIELCQKKVKVTVGVQKFFHIYYSSTLVQARNLILSMYVHLILIYRIYECCHA